MPDILNTTATTSSITGTGIYASALDVTNDSDWWRLSLKAGLTYSFKVTNGTGSSLFDATIAIRNADGTVVSPLVVDGEYLSFKALATGTFYLDVSDGDTADGVAEGGYMVSVNLDDKASSNPATQTTASIDPRWTYSPADVRGVLEGVNDVDWYRVDLAAGMNYSVTGASFGPSQPNNRVALVDRSGAVIAESIGDRPSFDFSVAATGTYYFAVSSGSFGTNGLQHYSFDAYIGDSAGNSIATAATVAAGSRTSTSIDSNVDSDWYRLDAQAGQTYHLEVASSGAYRAQTAGLYLMDAAGNVLSHVPRPLDGSEARLSYTALADGPLYVVVDTAGALIPDDPAIKLSVIGNYNLHVVTEAVELTGTDGDDVIEGWENANVISGRGGKNVAYGRGGDDIFISGEGYDTLDGGAGFDVVDFSATTGAIYLSFSDVNEYRSQAYLMGGGAATLYEIEGVISGSGNDTLESGLVSNLIDAGGGNDSLVGGGGNDTLCGGHGNDTIMGGAGEDTLIFAAGGGRTVKLNSASAQLTGEGRDLIAEIEHVIATNRNDAILGNGSANRLEGRDGNDVLAGGGANDTLIGGYGNDTIAGGAGEDTLIFANSTAGRVVNLAVTGAQATGEGKDMISGMEHVLGGRGNDFFTGNAFRNRLDGQGGNDVLTSGAGNDTILGGDGNDRLDGGAGIDLLVVGDRVNTFIDLARTTAYQTGQGTDRIVGIENVQGGLGNDRYFGDGNANQLFGGAGGDYLDGRDGRDVLLGGIGNDTLRGGAGRDSFIFEKGDGVDFVLDFDGAGDVIIIRSGAETYGDLNIQQAGSNVTIAYGNDLIILDTVQRSAIDASDFVFT